jgi:NTP pyrophosphatase (non-canonical NTP hydrolase)
MSEQDDLVEQAYHLPPIRQDGGPKPTRDRSVDAPKPRRVLVIDLDSGDWVGPATLQPGDSVRVASSVMPGWPAEAVEKAYGEYMADDGEETDHHGVIADGARGLDYLLQRQRDIEILWNRQVDPTDSDAVSAYIRDVVLCATDELHEVLGEVNWKPWKETRGIKDLAKYREEMADVLHFIFDLYLAAGLTGKDIILDYLAKNVENRARVSNEEYRNS